MVEKNFNTNVSSGSPSALVTLKDTRVSAKSPFSYFTNITITTKKSRALNVLPLKVRIKIPKLLVKKSLKKKKEPQSNSTNASNNNNNNNGSSSSSCTKKCRSPKKLFPNKITLLFSNVLGNKKLETGCINEKNNSSNSSDISGNVSRNADESCYHSRCIEKKAMIFDENGVDDDESDIFRTSSISNNNKGGQKTSMACELPLKKSSSFSSFFKRTPLNFMMEAKSITTTSMSSRRTSSIIGSSSSYPDIEKYEQSCKSSWVQARFRVNNKLMKSGSSRETASRGTMERDEEDKELCKRRILMGERCRPLNLPDSFHCDESGNPLSEPTITEK